MFSPPYNLEIPYGDHFQDNLQWTEYINFAHQMSKELFRVSVDGARVWVNVQGAVKDIHRSQDKNNDPRISLLQIWLNAMSSARFMHRDVIVWDQGLGSAGGCNWGSWRKPSNPNIRGRTEFLILCYKNTWERTAPEGLEKYLDPGDKDHPDIVGGPWIGLTSNLWNIQPSRDREAPAPFPEDLAARCIRLSTWPTENWLDVCNGSGVSTKVADELGRCGIGIDLEYLS